MRRGGLCSIWFRCCSVLCGREQLQREGNIGDGFELVADPTGLREDVMSTDLSAGDEPFCLFQCKENIQQAVPVKMAEFAVFFRYEFDSAQPVHLQSDLRQA